MRTSIVMENDKSKNSMNQPHKFLLFLIILITFIFPFIIRIVQHIYYFPTDNLIFELINFLPFIIPCLIYIKKRRLKWKDNLLVKRTQIHNYIYAIILGIFFQPLIFWSGSFATYIKTGTIYSPNELLLKMTSTSLIENMTGIIIVGIFTAVLEELLFRGIILNSYKGINIFITILMNGLLFSFSHFELLSIYSTFTIGAILTILTIVSKSILPSILLHFLLNAFHYVLNIISLDFSKKVYNILFSPILSIFSLLLIILLITFLIVKHIYPIYKEESKVSNNIDFKFFDKYILLLIVLVIIKSLLG